MNSRGLHLNDKGATRLAQNSKKFLSNIELGNVGTFSTEPVLNNIRNEAVSQVRNNLNENTADSLSPEVKNYKLENPKNITISHLNVNSLRNKFISIAELIKLDLT